jgi:hypothetical protein
MQTERDFRNVAGAHQANLGRVTTCSLAGPFEGERYEPRVADVAPDRPIFAFAYFFRSNRRDRVEGIEENEPARVSKTK